MKANEAVISRLNVIDQSKKANLGNRALNSADMYNYDFFDPKTLIISILADLRKIWYSIAYNKSTYNEYHKLKSLFKTFG